jgi:ribosomal-protein-alanine N-acetyltransferase
MPKEMHEKLLTPRMLGRRVTENDFDDVHRLNNDPQVAKSLGGPPSESQMREAFRNNLEHWERHGYGLWTFHLRQDDRFVGRAGIRNITIENVPEIELLYALMPEFWRQGFATEMARAILQVASALEISNLVAVTLPTNLGSRGVMEKVGFQFEREVTWANLPHVLYRLF